MDQNKLTHLMASLNTRDASWWELTKASWLGKKVIGKEAVCEVVMRLYRGRLYMMSVNYTA